MYLSSRVKKEKLLVILLGHRCKPELSKASRGVFSASLRDRVEGTGDV